jgi:two-component system CheB/CheR fusion protein
MMPQLSGKSPVRASRTPEDDPVRTRISQELGHPGGRMPASPFQQSWTVVAALAVVAAWVLWGTGNSRGALLVGPLAVVCCVRVPVARAALAAASALSALWIAAALVETGPTYPRLSPLDTAIALAATWTGAIFVDHAVALVRERSAASLKALADVKYALDQSAILATTDVRGIIRSVNRKFCEISKYSEAELLGQDHRIINSGHHSKEFIRDLWRTIAQGRIWRGELRNRARDGSIYWVDTTIVPLLDQRGKPYQYVAIRYDITERKRTEQQLREQESLARLGEMAAVVAHEVRNPIAGIKGVLQVLGGRVPEGSRDRAVLGEVVTRLDDLAALVQDLLVFARPTLPRPQRLSPRAAVQATMELLRRDAQLAGVELEWIGPDAPIAVDRQQFETVMLNILLNAAQAQQGQGRVHVTARPHGSQVAIRVRDEGPGIPPDIREHVFQPFFTTKHRGSGLGLATARRLTELNDGAIAVECPEDGGTVLTLTFPAAQPEGPAPSPV